MDFMQVVEKLAGVVGTIIGVIGGILGIPSYFSTRQQRRQNVEENDAMFEILRSLDQSTREGCGNGIIVEVNSVEHKLLERAVEKGLVARDSCRLGAYSFHSSDF